MNFKNLFKKDDCPKKEIDDIIQSFENYYAFHLKNKTGKVSNYKQSDWNAYLVNFVADLKLNDELFNKLKNINV